MSGGSMDYVYIHIKEAAGLTEDETIAHLLIDLSKVLHDEEWADCCDISYEEYQDTLLKFKRKWLEQEPITDYKTFTEWVATEIFSEDWERNKDSFAEIACRKLTKLGLVKAEGDNWVLKESEEQE